MNDRSKFDQPDLESLMPAVPFSRRGFLVSSAASGFALAAGPLMAQQAIKTPADGLDTGGRDDSRSPAARCRRTGPRRRRPASSRPSS